MALELTQPLTEMSTRSISRGKGCNKVRLKESNVTKGERERENILIPLFFVLILVTHTQVVSFKL